MTKNHVVRRRGAGRLTAEESAKLGDRLLDAAQALFIEKGFATTTMDDIARRAGSSTQTIYTRFASKAEMLEAVARRVIETTVSAHEAATSVDPGAVAPRDYLISLGMRVVGTLTSVASGLTRLSFAEGHRSAEVRRLTAEGFGRGTGLIRRALEHWREQGKLKLRGDPEALAALCLSMMTDRLRIRAALGERISPDEAKAHVTQAVDVFLSGCS